MSSSQEIKKELRAALSQYPDFPKPGILFEDIMPLFHQPALFRKLIHVLKEHVEPLKPTVIIGLDARGFLFGPQLALELNIGFVPVRKASKLPGELYTVSFEKEYGSDVFALQKAAIKPSDRVVVVDDIIATGGSAAAAGQLVEQAGGKVIEYVFLMELLFLKGREKLNAPVYTLLADQQ